MEEVFCERISLERRKEEKSGKKNVRYGAGKIKHPRDMLMEPILEKHE